MDLVGGVAQAPNVHKYFMFPALPYKNEGKKKSIEQMINKDVKLVGIAQAGVTLRGHPDKTAAPSYTMYATHTLFKGHLMHVHMIDPVWDILHYRLQLVADPVILDSAIWVFFYVCPIYLSKKDVNQAIYASVKKGKADSVQ